MAGSRHLSGGFPASSVGTGDRSHAELRAGGCFPRSGPVSSARLWPVTVSPQAFLQSKEEEIVRGSEQLGAPRASVGGGTLGEVGLSRRHTPRPQSCTGTALVEG